MPDPAAATLGDALRTLAARRNDAAAWEVLYHHLWPSVFAVARRALPPEAAEDAAQDVFLRIARYCPFDQLENEFVLKAYAARVAVRTSADHLRRRLVRAETPLLPQHDQPDPAAEFERQVEIVDLVDRVMRGLSPDDAILITYLVDQAGAARVATDQGVAYGTAAVRLHRLRRRLARLLFRSEV